MMPTFCLIVLQFVTFSYLQTDERSLLEPHEVAQVNARVSEYRSIASGPVPHTDAERKRILFLLREENELTAKVLVRSEGREGIAVVLGEEYSEYYARLLGTASQVADWSNEGQLRILAESAYNPDSPFAGRLAQQGELSVRVSLELTRHPQPAIRANAFAVLGMALTHSRQTGTQMLDMARTALLHGLEDPNTYARTHAVRAIGTIGTAADVPRLRGVAERDPASYGEPPVFPVRREAEAAIAKIQEREENQN